MFLSHITIHAADQQKEIAFYEKYAQLEIVRRSGAIVFMGNRTENETLIEIIEDKENFYTGSNLSIGFAVKDAAAYRESLAAEGLCPTEMRCPNPHVKFFFVQDPAGLTVQFIESV